MTHTPNDQNLHEMQPLTYQSLFDLNSDAILTLDLQGHIFNGNAAVEKIFGYLTEELRNKSFLEYIDENDLQQAQDSFELAKSGNRINEGRINIIHKKNESISCLVKFIPINQNKNNLSMFLILKDMRFFDSLSHKYRESELNFRIIAENVQDVIMLMDDQKRYLYISPSSKEMFGFDPTIINEQQQPFFNIHPDDVAIMEMNFEESQKTAEPFKVILKTMHTEKGWVWTEIKGTPVFNDKFSHLVLVARDITKQKEHEERLQYYAFHDSLTGLPNRRYFENKLSETIERLNMEGQTFSLFLLDIDDYKLINDSYGHEIGDIVLRVFAKRIQKVIKEEGIIARLGGDEFVLLFHRVNNEEKIKVIVENIQHAVRKTIETKNHSIKITTSIGVTICTTKNMLPSYFIKSADVALYNVKEKGKNQFHINFS